MNGRLKNPLIRTAFLGVNQITRNCSWLSTVMSGMGDELPIASGTEP